MSDLDSYRQEINKIDEQIIQLLGQRQQQVEGIIQIKTALNLPAHQPARFNEVVERCRQLAVENKLDPDVVEAIWNLLHEYFLKLEEAALKR